MNQITIPVTELKSALPGFSKIIGRKSTLPVLDSIRLTRTTNGNVSLEATDLDSHAIFHCTEPQPGTSLDVLVPFEPLNKVVKVLNGKESITIVQDGKKELRLKYLLGGSIMEQKVETLPSDEFPAKPKITAQDIQLNPEFGSALKQALQCCSEDQTRQVLRGACVDVEDKKLHYIVGTNGSALFSANSFAFDLKKSVIIPDSKFLNWTDMMDNGCKLTVEPPLPKHGHGYVQLKSDRWTFITREIEGKFPNWKQCVPEMKEPKTVIQLPPQAVRQILDVLPHLPGNNETNRIVRLSFQSSNLKIEGRSKESDWTGVFIQDAKITGKPVTIGLNREYLINALKFNLNEIQIEDELTPLVCISGGKKMVIMPVRLQGPATTQEKATPAKEPAPTTPTSQETTPAERKPDMPKETKPETKTTEQPSLIDQAETIKESLKTVIRDLSDLVDAVKGAEKEKRATEKEVESVRATLKKLQQVTI